MGAVLCLATCAIRSADVAALHVLHLRNVPSVDDWYLAERLAACIAAHICQISQAFFVSSLSARALFPACARVSRVPMVLRINAHGANALGQNR